jgi:hypothetical protein
MATRLKMSEARLLDVLEAKASLRIDLAQQ